MIKYFLFLLIVTLSASGQLKAQKPAEGKREEQVMQVLGMNQEQYKTYSRSLKDYDKRLTAVQKDVSLDSTTRRTAISKILSERKMYMEKNLSEEQRKKLYAFTKQNAPASARQKSQKDAEERMKKRGIRIIAKNDQ